MESGPFSLDAALNPHWRSTTWASDYNMVYLDNPRETGYSYADAGALCTDWQCYAADFDAWLAQFIVAFGFQKNDVYITGESYGGHYVPAAAFAVMQNNAAGRQPTINLAGVAIGNGFVAPYEMQAGYPEIIFNAGLISLENLAVALNYSARITEALDGDDYVGAYLIWDAFLNGDSTPGGAWFTNVTGLTNYFNVATETPPEFGFFVSYVTSPAVRTAIGVGNAKYNDGNLAVELALVGDVMFSQKPRVEALLQGARKCGASCAGPRVRDLVRAAAAAAAPQRALTSSLARPPARPQLARRCSSTTARWTSFAARRSRSATCRCSSGRGRPPGCRRRARCGTTRATRAAPLPATSEARPTSCRSLFAALGIWRRRTSHLARWT